MLHAVWYEDRAIQLLKFSTSQEVKKGPFAALTFESSKNFILRYFQKLMWFYLLVTKNSLLGKVWREKFFPLRNALDRSHRDSLLNIFVKRYWTSLEMALYKWSIIIIIIIKYTN